MPEPIKPPFTGDLQALVRLPDAVVLIVDDKLSFAAAIRYFPNNPVLSWLDTLPHAGVLAGRNVIVWPAAGGIGGVRWLELKSVLLPVCASLRMCGAAKQIVAMTAREAALTLRNPELVRSIEKRAEAPAQRVEAPVTPTAEPEPPVTKRKAEVRPSWRDMELVLSDKGVPIATLDNCVRVLERAPEFQGNIWLDTFLGRIVHRWNRDREIEWGDNDDISLALYLQRDIGIPRVSSKMAKEAVVAYGVREQRNCAYEWLDGLSWDGFDRLQDLSTRGFGAQDNAYTRAVCRNLILSMVKRVFEPGCKSDYMPIFEGSQGVGKSRALGIIGGQWFAESHESVLSKDFFGVLTGKWLIEISEMHAFKQADVDRIKGVVSCAIDRYRVPYGHHAADYPRQCAFAGTTNRDDWNRDDTGARRFWPVKCGVIDHQWLIDNRDQLFAEAVQVTRAGGSYWEVPWEVAEAEQEARRHNDTWEEVFEHYVTHEPSFGDRPGDRTQWQQRLAPLTQSSVAEFLTLGMNMADSRISRGDEMRAGRAMKAVGWCRTQIRVGDKRQWIYTNKTYVGDNSGVQNL